MNQLLTGLVLIVILVVKTGGAESNSETENCLDKNNHYIILIWYGVDFNFFLGVKENYVVKGMYECDVGPFKMIR